MKVVINEKLVSRNKKIGQYTTIGSLVILAAGLFASFNVQYINYSFVALIIGFITSQVGIFYGNKWGRSPRPDEKITQGLKGIGDKYTVYHYVTSVSHLLVGPGGIFVLLPYSQGGTIYYDQNKKRIRQKGGNLYLKIFAQESLGRPDDDAISNQGRADTFMRKLIKDIELPDAESILVFTNPKAIVQCEDSPITALHITKLKDYIRRKIKENALTLEVSSLIQKSLPTETES